MRPKIRCDKYYAKFFGSFWDLNMTSVHVQPCESVSHVSLVSSWAIASWNISTATGVGRKRTLTTRDENGTDIFRPYSIPNPFRGVLIRPYPSPDI
jgi:hypothetical protein